MQGLDQALEKIFHPEKFDFKNLNPEAEGNVDEGKFFHAGTDVSTEGLSAVMGAQMGFDMVAGQARASAIPRSMSVIEAPVAGKDKLGTFIVK